MLTAVKLEHRALVWFGKYICVSFQMAALVTLWKSGQIFLVFSSFFKTWAHTRNNSCIVGAFTNIETSHIQTARPGTTSRRPYKYLCRAGIKIATRSAAVDCSAAAPTVSSVGTNCGRVGDHRNLIDIVLH